MTFLALFSQLNFSDFLQNRTCLQNPTPHCFVPNTRAALACILMQASPSLEAFYRERVKEKLLPQVRYWELQTVRKPNDTRLLSFQSR